MVDILTKYKQNKIDEFTSYYNNTVKILQTQLVSKINQINRSRLRNGPQIANALKMKFSQETVNLKNVYIQNINKVKTTNYDAIFPTTFKSKKGLLFGINYIGTQRELGGCINDAKNVNNYLMNDCKFDECEMLTDFTSMKPTKVNILNKITQLLDNAETNDLLFIYFSGHGSYSADTTGDEIDGRDESILSHDLKTIVDDEIRNIFNLHINKNITIVCLFDSCHSGSMLDLKYTYDISARNYVENHIKNCDGNVLMISGCMDDQYGIDVHINNENQGAMTFVFLETLKKNPKCSWNYLITNMNMILKNNEFVQCPQLSSNKFYNIDTSVFL